MMGVALEGLQNTNWHLDAHGSGRDLGGCIHTCVQKKALKIYIISIICVLYICHIYKLTP